MNFSGDMSKLALRTPRVAIALAEAVRLDEESGRPSCRTFELAPGCAEKRQFGCPCRG